MYSIQNIEPNAIVVDNNDYTDNDFSKKIVVAYCYTNHKVQGITIKEDYIIYEWNKMSIRERYTAYSRCIDGSKVRLLHEFKEGDKNI
jgi:hypothetical protein